MGIPLRPTDRPCNPHSRIRISAQHTPASYGHHTQAGHLLNPPDKGSQQDGERKGQGQGKGRLRLQALSATIRIRQDLLAHGRSGSRRRCRQRNSGRLPCHSEEIGRHRRSGARRAEVRLPIALQPPQLISRSQSRTDQRMSEIRAAGQQSSLSQSDSDIGHAGGPAICLSEAVPASRCRVRLIEYTAPYTQQRKQHRRESDSKFPGPLCRCLATPSAHSRPSWQKREP